MTQDTDEQWPTREDRRALRLESRRAEKRLKLIRQRDRAIESWALAAQMGELALASELGVIAKGLCEKVRESDASPESPETT